MYVLYNESILSFSIFKSTIIYCQETFFGISIISQKLVVF